MNWTEFEHFFLDQNHLETLKVMTFTFDLEKDNRPYLLKLWCIQYLNANFDGCSLKTVYVANLYITIYIGTKKEKTSMTSGDLDLWDMVTKQKSVQSRGCA